MTEFRRAPKSNRFVVPTPAVAPPKPATNLSLRRAPKAQSDMEVYPGVVGAPAVSNNMRLWYYSEDFHPQTLPSVPFALLCNLPDICAVYFALHSSGEVLYIGSSTHMRQRWAKQHNHASTLKRLDCERIHWHETDESEMLAIERHLIRKFRPRVNTRGNTTNTLLPIWMPNVLYEAVLAYGERELMNLQELVHAGLIYVLNGDPALTRMYTSRKAIPQQE